MRKIFDIHGGVHPAENKHQSMQRPITVAGIPPELIIPVGQHIGAPAKPTVAVGERVLKGQVIAEANGFVSVAKHASSSGTVSAIEDRAVPHQSGLPARCVVIETDGKDEWISDLPAVADYTTLDPAQLLERIRNAGIAGMGGAGFPSAVKLGPNQPIDTLVINGTECEPYITADDALMRERADEIIAGVEILRYLIKPTEATVIGIEDNKPEAIAAMQAAAGGSDIEIAVFPTKYPSGGEKQLIQILTGREVKSGGLPADVGVVCQNIGTATAINRAIKCGEPLLSRITTVTGDACSNKGNFEVLIGTPVRWLLDLGGYDPKACSRLIMGGPMMGFTLHDDSVPIVKTTNCLLAPTATELPPPQPAQACIRCGMCAEACPVSLLPQQMYWFARAQEHDKLEEHNLFDCIECGACSYACPSHIPLVQYYRAAKGEILHHREEKKKAEQSKARFEARQARIEREEQEKEAKRQARKEAAKARAAAAAKAGDGAGDAVADAVARAQAKRADGEAKTTVATAPSADPAQQAIEKAMAARAAAADASPLQKAQKTVDSLRARIEKTETKHAAAAAAGDDTAAILETTLQTLNEKLRKAETELTELQGDASAAQPTAADPAQLAIERAKAARAASANMSPAEKAEKAVTSLQSRIAKTRDKLQAAQDAGDDTAEILAETLAKLEQKLVDAEAELAALKQEASN